MIRCYLVEPAMRYYASASVELACGHEWQSARHLIDGDVHASDAVWSWEGFEWPTACATCGATIDWDEARRSGSRSPIWRRADDGVEATMNELPPGAIYNAYWLGEWARRGIDGRCLHVVLPNGMHWHVDGEASNCTRKGEDHDCWCRHGEPPNVTVDKTPEPGRSTCAAGAGSIAMGDYHGFLRNGELVPA